MKKYIVKNWFTARSMVSKPEINSGEIMTVPDLAYTPEEILQKFTRGVQLDIVKEAEYSDSDDFDYPDNDVISDLTDIEEIMQKNIQREKRILSRRDQRTTRPEPAPTKAGDGSGVKSDPSGDI